MSDLWNSSPIGRLLEEISWEGRSVRAYRDGGRGRENVLTAEALMLLDFLPRREFLGGVVESARGADGVRRKLLDGIEHAAVTLLPDETRLGAGVVVQPDAALETNDVYGLIEAKRIRTSSFQVPQLSREWTAAWAQAGDRDPLLFLILGAPPPVPVKGRGRMTIADAILLDLDGPAPKPTPDQIDNNVAWTTWDDVQSATVLACGQFTDDSTSSSTVLRLSSALVRTIDWHR